MEFDYKIFLGVVAVLIGMYGYVAYAIDIFKGNTRPHSFSWLIWSILTTIAFVVQWQEGAGPGSWVTGSTAIVAYFFFFVGLRFNKQNIARSDWITLVAALSAIPLWLVTKNALLSILIVTAIDALGFYPTIRKTYFEPNSESIANYYAGLAKHSMSIAALSAVTFVNYIYPLSLVVMNGVIVAIILWKR